MQKIQAKGVARTQKKYEAVPGGRKVAGSKNGGDEKERMTLLEKERRNLVKGDFA